jgi:hypothetical protein
MLFWINAKIGVYLEKLGGTQNLIFGQTTEE